MALIFSCCHPALDPGVRVPLTLRAVCGLDTAAIAAVFLVPEPRMAQRLVRAKRKIWAAAIPFRVPALPDLPARLDDVLQVVYLMFTEGHDATRGPAPIRDELCDAAIRLARTLAALLPEQGETSGLLALLLLTDARRPARLDATGGIVLLGDQDRTRWDQDPRRRRVDRGHPPAAASRSLPDPGGHRRLSCRRAGPGQHRLAAAAERVTAQCQVIRRRRSVGADRLRPRGDDRDRT